MKHRFRIVAFVLLFAFAAVSPHIADARVQKVGPTQFHKQMNIPNAIGRNGTANNQDSYTESVWNKRHKQRMNRHQKRKQQNQSANTESRTASDNIQKTKRKGRRDNNVTARERRLQQKALNAMSGKTGPAVND